MALAQRFRSRLRRTTDEPPNRRFSRRAVRVRIVSAAVGTRPAIVGGVRKMPLPMVMPTMRAVPPQKPMTRRSVSTGEESWHPWRR